MPLTSKRSVNHYLQLSTNTMYGSNSLNRSTTSMESLPVTRDDYARSLTHLLTSLWSSLILTSHWPYCSLLSDIYWFSLLTEPHYSFFFTPSMASAPQTLSNSSLNTFQSRSLYLPLRARMKKTLPRIPVTKQSVSSPISERDEVRRTNNIHFTLGRPLHGLVHGPVG